MVSASQLASTFRMEDGVGHDRLTQSSNGSDPAGYISGILDPGGPKPPYSGGRTRLQ